MPGRILLTFVAAGLGGFVGGMPEADATLREVVGKRLIQPRGPAAGRRLCARWIWTRSIPRRRVCIRWFAPPHLFEHIRPPVADPEVYPRRRRHRVR